MFSVGDTAMERDLYGFGGWLILFTIGLGILTPIVEIVAVYPMLFGADSALFAPQIENWGTFKAVFIALIVGEWALFFYTCYRLIKVYDRATVQLTRIVIWLGAIVLPALGILIMASFIGMPFGDLYAASFAESPIEMIRPLIWATIWTLYFAMSKRVKQTYLDPDDDETGQVFA